MNCIFHIGSKEAELVCIELENESGKIKQIEQIITQKMKREIIIDNVTEKKYCKKSKYDRCKRQTMRQSLKSTPPIIGDVASCIRPEDYLTMA